MLGVVHKLHLQVVQKCQLFVNVHKVEDVNRGGQVVKKSYLGKKISFFSLMFLLAHLFGLVEF